MTIRNTVEADLDTIFALIEQKSVNTVTAERFREYVASGYYKHEWNWVVEENGAIQALAIWWGVPGESHPYSIDGLYYAGDGAPVPVWTELLKYAVASRACSMPSRRSTTSSWTATGRTSQTSSRRCRSGVRRPSLSA